MDATGKIGATLGKARSWWVRPSPLGIIFVVLVALSIGRQLVDARPRPTRMVVENKCPDTINHLVVEGPSGTTDLGSLAPRGRMPLAMTPRKGETYVIQGHEVSGEELVRQIEIARQEREDVVIGILWSGEGYAEVYLGGYLPLADPARKTRR